MQRLTKYPLLLRRLYDIVQDLAETDPDSKEELRKLQLAYDRSKEILEYVNEAAKEAESRAKLEDIQMHLDISLGDRMDRDIQEIVKVKLK